MRKGFLVYQYEKLCMLQFYYDFIDRYVERPLLQYGEMDTKSVHCREGGMSVNPSVIPFTSDQ